MSFDLALVGGNWGDRRRFYDRSMACRGVLFALTKSQDEALVATRGDAEVRAFVHDVERDWDRDWLCQVDKAWDAMHRCLGDGTLWLGRHGGGPLALAVLGGGQHYEGTEYIVAHVLADQVPAVAEARLLISGDPLRVRSRRSRSSGSS